MSCDNGSDDGIVHIKFKIDGEDHWVAWNEDEAKKKGFHSLFEDKPFPLNNIIASMMNKSLPIKYEAENNPQCPNCGLSFVELLDIGRIGCAHCYNAFGEQMENLLEKLHGSKTHIGFIPERKSKKTKKRLSKKDSLKLKLNKAIKTEDYEQAASLRDQLRELETAH